MRNIVPALIVTLALVLTACAGYRLEGADDAPLALPEESRTLFIKSVNNPTMDPGLDSTLRSRLRDEFTRRGKVRWVDSDEASAFMHLKVTQFTSSTAITGADDETIKSASSISLEAWVINRKNGNELWRSTASASESFYTGGREEAESKVIALAVRRLADNLAQDF